MITKNFTLEVNQGKLTIPPEISAYLLECQGKIKVSLTVESSLSEDHTLKRNWDQWFEEVENLNCLPINNEENYKKLLFDKYKKQGLEL
jgi:hypothetical protein